jgi:hypothetical protein
MHHHPLPEPAKHPDWHARIKALTSDLLDGEKPQELIADLWEVAHGFSGPKDGVSYRDEPAWQFANSAFIHARPGLLPREQEVRRFVAAEVMFRIESAYKAKKVS